MPHYAIISAMQHDQTSDNNKNCENCIAPKILCGPHILFFISRCPQPVQPSSPSLVLRIGELHKISDVILSVTLTKVTLLALL